MSRELDRQLAGLRQGDHLCQIYEKTGDQLATLVAFFREGLCRGERCIYVAEYPDVERLAAALASAGVDVPRERQRESLLLVSDPRSYSGSGGFDPDQTIAALRSATQQALDAGFAGIRGAGDATWVFGGEIDLDVLTRYEALLNESLSGIPAVAICQYHRSLFAPAVLHQILRTHPVAVLGDMVCPNHFYEPPEMVLGEEKVAERVEWMISQLQRAREAELTLEESSELLEARVAERTAALAQELQRRQQAEEERSNLLALRDEYISLISHDLRNPLTSLMGQSQFLQRRLTQLGLEQETHTVEVIVKNAKRMSAMLEDLLESVRLESSGVELRRESCDLLQLASDVVEQLTSTESRNRIEVRPVCTLPQLQADPEHLERALMNLITNALKYSPPGSPVLLLLDRREADAIITVSDQGEGIPPEVLPHLFQRFYRVKTKRSSEGLGLGLYITRLIAEAHGGRVWVESKPGKGTSFYLALPIDTTPPIP